MPSMPALRGLRGSVVGLSACGLGLAGHAMAGGALPSPLTLAAVTAGFVVLGVAMSSRTWTLPSLLAVLVGAQALLHVLLAGSAQAHAMAAMPGMTATHGMAPDASMAAAHLVAAALAAVLLRRGELWCQSLVELLSRPLRAISLPALPAPLRRSLVTFSADTAPVSPLLVHSLSRRGPPALSPA
jgi:hypothetical protein